MIVLLGLKILSNVQCHIFDIPTVEVNAFDTTGPLSTKFLRNVYFYIYTLLKLIAEISKIRKLDELFNCNNFTILYTIGA